MEKGSRAFGLYFHLLMGIKLKNVCQTARKINLRSLSGMRILKLQLPPSVGKFVVTTSATSKMPHQEMQQESSFVESCLPKTMALAEKHKDSILNDPMMRNHNWSFSDRVLVWLLPSYHAVVNQYYQENGRQMLAQLGTQDIEKIDSATLRILANKLLGMTAQRIRTKRKPKHTSNEVYSGVVRVPREKDS